MLPLPRKEKEMNFDELYRIGPENDCIEYGCVVGSNRIVYIKVGMSGSYIGYEEKYLKMACRLNDNYGCSVICVSNPLPHGRSVALDQIIIRDFVKRHNILNPEMFFFGNSNGCAKGLEMAESGMQFAKMMLVGMPLMENFHKNVERMKAIPETKICTVYGERDPSLKYLPFLELLNPENVEIVKVPQADHNFRGMTERFVELADWLME